MLYAAARCVRKFPFLKNLLKFLMTGRALLQPGPDISPKSSAVYTGSTGHQSQQLYFKWVTSYVVLMPHTHASLLMPHLHDGATPLYGCPAYMLGPHLHVGTMPDCAVYNNVCNWRHWQPHRQLQRSHMVVLWYDLCLLAHTENHSQGRTASLQGTHLT